MTPLHIACSRGAILVVNHLLEVDCGIEAVTYDGKTALDLARLHDHQHIVNRLMQHKLSRSFTSTATNPRLTSVNMPLLSNEAMGLPPKRQQLPALGSSASTSQGSLDDDPSYSLLDNNFTLLSFGTGTKTNECCEAFRRLFLNESKQKKVVEKRVDALQQKISTLMNQLDGVYKLNNDLEENLARLHNECKYFKGDGIEEMNRFQCESFEKELKILLERIEIRKVIIK